MRRICDTVHARKLKLFKSIKHNAAKGDWPLFLESLVIYEVQNLSNDDLLLALENYDVVSD